MSIPSRSVRRAAARLSDSLDAALLGCARRARALAVRAGRALSPERGDVPGWVLVTLMTAGLVVALWTVAGPALVNIFTSAMNKVTGAI
ncbi:hypothetical protein [Actinomyces gaoshouyii]|uniref:Uncharacterized protein n=1 Tax=Actinomyces gaoshouyii TaxID=1960083 RepID=A0A8H9H7Y1_9ACTO|nr:hypothetical protein [Actinomyces gaoshouyii]GGO96880.1 hypothetical protein GCM10011612_08150 [Actinomyces gaoshouyii]